MSHRARSVCAGWGVGLLLVVLACPARSQSADLGDAAERSRIAAERRAVQARFDSARVACETRFVVTGCLDAARAERRQALDQLQRQQVVLDEARRRERAARRQRDIETRAAGADERDAQPPAPARPAASATVPSARRPAHAAPSASSASASAEALAQRRRVTFAHRQAAAREHQRAVEERNARHDAQHKPAAGLPLPAAPASTAPR